METEKVDGSISFDDFLKVDVRVGTIVVAEKIEKSKKLLRLEVDFGELGRRQILAGIGETYQNTETLINMQTLFVVNLAPRKMMGLESHGMILAATSKTGDAGLFYRFDDSIANGVRLG